MSIRFDPAELAWVNGQTQWLTEGLRKDVENAPDGVALGPNIARLVPGPHFKIIEVTREIREGSKEKLFFDPESGKRLRG